MLAVTAVLGFACGLEVVDGQGRGSAIRVEASDEAMGTTFTVVVHGLDRETLNAAARVALDEAIRLDRLLSNYLPNSEWSRVNREAARGPVAVSPELFAVLEACLAFHRDTEGAFDITVGPLMKVWGFYKGEGTLPATDSIRRTLVLVGSRHVQLDRARGTVEFRQAGVELDPGGIGKGYAIDRMVALLKGRGVTSAFVTAGASSMYGLGAPPEDARGWVVSIRDPRTPSRTAASVWLRDASLSTSGSYEKFFRAGGREYSHIMDPRTGFPARGTSSVSVVAPRTIDSEAWTKAYFVNGRAWASGRRQAATRVFMCDDGDQGRCDWVR